MMTASKCTLDKCLAESDLLIQSFKNNPRQFINGFSQRRNKTGAKKNKPGNSKEESEEEENEEDLEPFTGLKKGMIKMFLELKKEEENDEDFCKYSLQMNEKLIEKMVKKLGLSYLILNLYPNNEGYSLAIKKFTNCDDKEELIETLKLPYEEDELLNFIDNEELPPMLVDLFDSLGDDIDFHLFYYGSIFLEIRDYRKNATDSLPYYESNFVRLKPTTQTILNDVTKLTSSFCHKKWTREEKVALEAKLILETSEPLCLDPSPVVAIISNRLEYEKNWIKSSKKIERKMKKNSQVFFNRTKKFQSMVAPKGLELFDFLKHKNNRSSPSSRLNKKINVNTNDINNTKEQTEQIDPSLVNVEALVKRLEPVENDYSLVKFGEHVIEFLDSEGRTSKTSITIHHDSFDDSYYGQLNVDKHDSMYKAEDSCFFRLGHRSMVDKYIEQFTEILTEKRRKPHRIIRNLSDESTFTDDNINVNISSETDTYSNEQYNIPKKPKIVQNLSLNATSSIPNTPLVSSMPSILSIPSQIASKDNHSNLVSQSSKTTAISSKFKTTSISSSFSIPSIPIKVNASFPKQETSLAVLLTSLPQGQGEINSQTHLAAEAVPLSDNSIASPAFPVGSYSLSPAQSSSNTANLPQGVNLANLNLPSCPNVRLHNVIPFSNAHRTSQQITVPISLTMMPGNATSQSPNINLSTVPNGAQSSATLMSNPGNMIVRIETSTGLITSTLWGRL